MYNRYLGDILQPACTSLQLVMRERQIRAIGGAEVAAALPDSSRLTASLIPRSPPCPTLAAAVGATLLCSRAVSRLPAPTAAAQQSRQVWSVRGPLRMNESGAGALRGPGGTLTTPGT